MVLYPSDNFYSISLKNAIGILMGIALNLFIVLSNMPF